ncbi:Potassium channel [Podila minutissima]|uniref:Potassium channel n=1 Tax=Podila minutissima TaxID=64525 RepID=A0A9P5SK77_9FUNG|nr:Potassium channel [Podila minutissima]
MITDSSQSDQHPPNTVFQQRHRHRPSIHPILEEGRRISRAFRGWNAQDNLYEKDTSDTNSTLTSFDGYAGSQYSDGKSFISSDTDGSFHRNAASSTKSYNPSIAPMDSSPADSIPHAKLEKAGPYLTIGALQAYTCMTVVRCLADSTWMVMRTSDDKSGGRVNEANMGEIGVKEKIMLGLCVGFMVLSCVGFTLRIMDKLPWLRRIPVIAAVLQSIFCTAAMITFLAGNKLPEGAQYSHGFLACAISIVFSTIVALMLTVDWWRGFPSAGLTVTLKALIISSFVMTIVIIVGAAIYTALEGWSFDEAVNFCIVSFATIGYGNISPKTVAGQIVFFTFGILGISVIAFFIVSLRTAVVEQFEWRLVEKFSRPAHMIRVQTRMSVRDLSYPIARFEEEQRVKKAVKRTMIIRMFTIWIFLWFGGAGVFCAVTLTTIGFGDYVPKEPGAIEFWNIYVFVGLSVFAYILSLFSESMASNIHLVDDEDLDGEDEMIGWEQCEDDPNAPWSNWSGMLGLEGQKWAQQPQQLRHDQNGTDGDNLELVPGQEKNQPRSPTSVTFQEPDNLAHRSPLTNDQHWQLKQQQHQQMMRNHAKRRSSAGRILLIPAKERKQMLEAEYYATHGGMMAQAPSGHAELADINAHYDTMYASDTSLVNGSSSQNNINENASTHSRTSMISVPTTIRFVDSRGVPHQRRRMSLVSANGFGKGGMVGASAGLADNAPGEIVGHFDPYGGGVTFGTPAYYSAMGKRRQQRLSDRTLGRSVSVGGFERQGNLLQRSGSNGMDWISNQSPEQMSPGSRVTTPTRQQVRFESLTGSPKSLAAQRISLQDQNKRDRQEWRAQKEMEEMVKANAFSTVSTPLAHGQGNSGAFDRGSHMDPLAANSTAPVDIPMNSSKLPWPSEGNGHDFWTPSALKHPCESRSSGATKFTSPELTHVRASTSSENLSSLSPAPDFSQPVPQVPSSPHSLAATSGSVADTDSTEPMGPLGEVRTEDKILKFEKDIDLNQVNDPPLVPPKGHMMPKKKKSPLSSSVQITRRKGSRRSSIHPQESNDPEPSNSALPPKMNVFKDIGPLNETRDTETILKFENEVDLNSDIEAPKADPPPDHLRKKSSKKKVSQKKSTQTTDNPPGGIQGAKAPPGKPADGAMVSSNPSATTFISTRQAVTTVAAGL